MVAGGHSPIACRTRDWRRQNRRLLFPFYGCRRSFANRVSYARLASSKPPASIPILWLPAVIRQSRVVRAIGVVKTAGFYSHSMVAGGHSPIACRTRDWRRQNRRLLFPFYGCRRSFANRVSYARLASSKPPASIPILWLPAVIRQSRVVRAIGVVKTAGFYSHSMVAGGFDEMS